MSIYIKYNLKDDEIKYNSFEDINDYNKVVYIKFSSNQLSSLPKLPNLLLELYCVNSQLTELPELPNLLKYFYHNENKFIKIIKYKYLKTMIYM